MKFTHYDYKNFYIPSADIAIGKRKKAGGVVSQRSQLNLDHEYHTTWINIFTEDVEITNFDLGVDFSLPDYTKSRSIDRLYLNFITRGKGHINGVPFSAGQFYYTLPNESHTIKSDKDDPFVSVWISLKGLYAQYIANELNKKSKSKIMAFERRNDIMELTKTFLYTINLGETSTSYLKSLITIYLSYITSNQTTKYPEAFDTEKTTNLIKESKAFVRRNLKYVTVADMAEAQHYSVKYFSHVFTEATGMKPYEYITDCRMEWAKASLTYSDLSITEIMEAIGYEHRNGFNIAFKKKYGCPPAEYRRKNKK